MHKLYIVDFSVKSHLFGHIFFNLGKGLNSAGPL